MEDKRVAIPLCSQTFCAKRVRPRGERNIFERILRRHLSRNLCMLLLFACAVLSHEKSIPRVELVEFLLCKSYAFESRCLFKETLGVFIVIMNLFNASSIIFMRYCLCVSGVIFLSA